MDGLAPGKYTNRWAELKPLSVPRGVRRCGKILAADHAHAGTSRTLEKCRLVLQLGQEFSGWQSLGERWTSQTNIKAAK